MSTTRKTPSVNKLSRPLVKALVDNADKLRLNVTTMDNGCTIVDAGIDVESGQSFHTGCLDEALLEKSFGA